MEAGRIFALVLRVGIPLIVLAIVGAMALGRVGATIGAVGLVVPIAFALGSSIVKNRRLRKAMLESDMPEPTPPESDRRL